MKQTESTKRLTFSAMMIAMSSVLAIICSLIPFLRLPFGGSFTLASMLPIVIISYMFGIRRGLFSAFTYSLIQIILDIALGTGGSAIMALFMPSSDSYMGVFAGICIIFFDYFLAYTLLGLGGIFRNRFKSKATSLCLGSAFALSLTYLAHIVSGYIFYGAWAEWFFSQSGFYSIGTWITAHLDGRGLALVYSVFYNGLYMIPEIIITSVVALVISRIPQIKKSDM